MAHLVVGDDAELCPREDDDGEEVAGEHGGGEREPDPHEAQRHRRAGPYDPREEEEAGALKQRKGLT